MPQFDAAVDALGREQAGRIRFKYAGPLPPHSFAELTGVEAQMSLVTGLLILPPALVRGVVWVAEQVEEEADRQLYDEDVIRSEPLALELDAEEGRISPEEQECKEDELLERLPIAQSWRSSEPDEWEEGPYG